MAGWPVSASCMPLTPRAQTPRDLAPCTPSMPTPSHRVSWVSIRRVTGTTKIGVHWSERGGVWSTTGVVRPEEAAGQRVGGADGEVAAVRGHGAGLADDGRSGNRARAGTQADLGQGVSARTPSPASPRKSRPAGESLSGDPRRSPKAVADTQSTGVETKTTNCRCAAQKGLRSCCGLTIVAEYPAAPDGMDHDLHAVRWDRSPDVHCINDRRRVGCEYCRATFDLQAG